MICHLNSIQFIDHLYMKGNNVESHEIKINFDFWRQKSTFAAVDHIFIIMFHEQELVLTMVCHRFFYPLELQNKDRISRLPYPKLSEIPQFSARPRPTMNVASSVATLKK